MDASKGYCNQKLITIIEHGQRYGCFHVIERVDSIQGLFKRESELLVFMTRYLYSVSLACTYAWQLFERHKLPRWCIRYPYCQY